MSATLYRTSAAQLTAGELSHIHQQMALRSKAAPDVGAMSAHDPNDPDASDTMDDDADDDTGNDASPDGRHRQHIEREWPSVGTKLVASYFGTDYTATIIPASKKLKSGKQIRIESGPTAGTVCDSYSQAMIVATEAQREAQNLARKGVSNGWLFWNPA